MGSEKKDEGPFAQDDAKPEEEKVSWGGCDDFQVKAEDLKMTGGLRNFS